MTKTNSLTDKICGAALMAMATLPIAALSTAAHAATVKVSDLNLASAQGVATFEQRAHSTARAYCADERGIAHVAACRAGVTSELAEKMVAARAAQLSQATSVATR